MNIGILQISNVSTMRIILRVKFLFSLSNAGVCSECEVQLTLVAMLWFSKFLDIEMYENERYIDVVRKVESCNHHSSW